MRTSIFKEYWEIRQKYTFVHNVIVSGIAAVIKCGIVELPIKHTNKATGDVSIQKIKLLRVDIKSLF